MNSYIRNVTYTTPSDGRDLKFGYPYKDQDGYTVVEASVQDATELFVWEKGKWRTYNRLNIDSQLDLLEEGLHAAVLRFLNKHSLPRFTPPGE
jgi:hypothetical protein